MRSFHSILAGALLVSGGAARQPPLAPMPASSSFTVFVRGVPVGSAQTSVSRGADGWTITSAERMGAPMDIVARRVEVRYTDDWRPIELVVDASLRGQPLSIQTNVTGQTAQTPCADVSATASMGIVQVLTDPRTTLAQCLNALLTAELTDNAGWELLIDLAEELGHSDMADEFTDPQRAL